VDKDSLEEQLLLASLDSKSCINGWSNRLFISRNSKMMEVGPVLVGL